MKRAVIFGASGQAGRYLRTFLAGKDYEIVRTIRQPLVSPYPETFVERNVVTVGGVDLSQEGSAERVIRNFKPDECYNMAAQMYAPASWEKPSYYLKVNGLAVAEMLDAISKVVPRCKFFQAGSAEMFSRRCCPQNERTPICPSNPYAVAKVMALNIVRAYRRKGLFACTGIFFNMESPLRKEFFFAKKVTREAVRIASEESPRPMVLGGLRAVRDWGLTEEYVEAPWLMLQAERPRDYVIGTGVGRSCEEFVIEALFAAGVGVSRPGEDMGRYVVVDPHWEQPKQDFMVADPSKIREELGWQAKSTFTDVVTKLVREEQSIARSVKLVEGSTSRQP